MIRGGACQVALHLDRGGPFLEAGQRSGGTPAEVPGNYNTAQAVLASRQARAGCCP